MFSKLLPLQPIVLDPFWDLTKISFAILAKLSLAGESAFSVTTFKSLNCKLESYVGGQVSDKGKDSKSRSLKGLLNRSM